MSDEELAKKGNKEAFERLIEENKKYLLNIAILGNEEDVGDAIVETIKIIDDFGVSIER